MAQQQQPLTAFLRQPGAAAAAAAVVVDPFRWAWDGGMYVVQDEVAAALRAGSRGMLVVDVRDDDRAGGHVAGSLHMPDAGFDVAALLAALRTDRTPGEEVVLVFTCMESARRGPRCARRVFEHLAAAAGDGAGGADAGSPAERVFALELEGGGQARISLRVLRGGTDQWMRRFWRDGALVAGYDDEYWGFAGTLDQGDSGQGDSGDNEAAQGQKEREASAVEQPSAAAPQHRLYQRPADQPATPWSGPGRGE